MNMVIRIAMTTYNIINTNENVCMYGFLKEHSLILYALVVLHTNSGNANGSFFMNRKLLPLKKHSHKFCILFHSIYE